VVQDNLPVPDIVPAVIWNAVTVCVSAPMFSTPPEIV